MAVQTTPTVTQQWFTVKDAATYAGLSPETIRRLVNSGKIQGTYMTKRALRVSRGSLDAHAYSNRTNQYGGAA